MFIRTHEGIINLAKAQSISIIKYHYEEAWVGQCAVFFEPDDFVVLTPTLESGLSGSDVENLIWSDIKEGKSYTDYRKFLEEV